MNINKYGFYSAAVRTSSSRVGAAGRWKGLDTIIYETMRHQSFMNLVPTLIALRQLADDLESIGQDLFAKLLRLISEHDWIEG